MIDDVEIDRFIWQIREYLEELGEESVDLSVPVFSLVVRYLLEMLKHESSIARCAFSSAARTAVSGAILCKMYLCKMYLGEMSSAEEKSIARLEEVKCVLSGWQDTLLEELKSL
jgi:hypothetical protein